MNSVKKRVITFDASEFESEDKSDVFTLKKAKSIKDPVKTLMQAELKVENISAPVTALYSSEEMQKLKCKQNFVVAKKSSLEGLELTGEQAEEIEALSESLLASANDTGKRLTFSKKVSFDVETKESDLDQLSLKNARFKNLEDLNSNKSTRLSTTVIPEDLEFIPLHAHKDISVQSKLKENNLHSWNSLETEEESSAVLWENELLQRANIGKVITNDSNRSNRVSKVTENGFTILTLKELIKQVSKYSDTVTKQYEDSQRQVQRLQDEYKYSLEKVQMQEQSLKNRLQSAPNFQVSFYYYYCKLK